MATPRKDFLFKEYDRAELCQAGAAFVRFLRANKDAFDAPSWRGATPWTDLVLEWFSRCHAPDVVIDRNARSTHPDEWKQLMGALQGAPHHEEGSWLGEALKLDLFASRAPPYSVKYFSEEYWKRYLAHTDVTSLLALESEWKGDSAEDRYTCVMHSAAKLAIVNTKLKVLVFCSGQTRQPVEQQDRFLKDVGVLRAKHRPLVPWLLIDVPYRAWDANPPAAFVSKLDGDGWEPQT